jgi:hypothetical protein
MLMGMEDEMKIEKLEMFRNTQPQALCSLARKAIATTLVAAFTICSVASAAGTPVSPQAGTEKTPTLRERVLAIPPHAMVQVKLHNKEKIKGRLGEVTNEGFDIQTATGDKIDNQKISFDDVKSIKEIDEGKRGHRLATNIVVGAAVGVLALIVIGAVAYAHTGD